MEEIIQFGEVLKQSGITFSGNPKVGIALWDKQNRGVIIHTPSGEAKCLYAKDPGRLQADLPKPEMLAKLPVQASGAEVDAAALSYLTQQGLPKIQSLFAICPASLPSR